MERIYKKLNNSRVLSKNWNQKSFFSKVLSSLFIIVFFVLVLTFAFNNRLHIFPHITTLIAASTDTTTSGTQYYIDCNGNDANSGLSPDKPWKSVSKANAASLSPGDALRFKYGCTFTGTLNAKWNGTASEPVVIGAYGDSSLQKPLIQYDAQGKFNVNGIITVDGSYETVENLRVGIINPGTFQNKTINGVGGYTCKNVSDGKPTPYTWAIGFSLSGNHNTVQYSEASGDLTIGLYLPENSSYNKALHNNFHNIHAFNKITTKPAQALGAWGILIHGEHNEVAYNTSANNEAKCNLYDSSGTFISTPYYSATFELYNADYTNFHHNIGLGAEKNFEMGHDCDFNYFQTNGKCNKTADHNTIAYNLFASDVNRANGPNIHSTAWVKNANGTWSYQFGPVTNTTIENNTFFFTGAGSEGIICACGDGYNLGSVNKVINNIFVDAGGSSSRYTAWMYGSPTSLIEDHNIYWRLGDSPKVYIGGGSAIDSTSKMTDPLLVSEAFPNGNYHLQSTSPAINAGANLSFTSDLDGVNLPQGTGPDIGVYEYSAGGTSTPIPTPTSQVTPTLTSAPQKVSTSTITPTPQTTSKPVVKANVGCLAGPVTSGKVFTVSWTQTNPSVKWVDISTRKTYKSFYHTNVSGQSSVSGPENFYMKKNTKKILSFSPSTTYYIRTFNGVTHSPTVAFSIPTCSTP